ncbi:MAG: hypothetical protein KAH57_11855, partial [Thermoplasmata archaeon]|nr:hypothetical protein [Thermoplasmata archaeon]
MMSVRIGKPFNWLKGWASTAVITFCVLTLLAFNLIALGMALPRVIDAAPEKYGSGLEGSLHLPYVPDSIQEMEISVEKNVTEGEPFPFSMTFPDAEKPYGLPQLTISNGSSEYSYVLGAGFAQDGRCRLSVLVPGLPYSGRWDLTFLLSVGASTHYSDRVFQIGSIWIIEASGGRPVLIPDLDELLAFDGAITFTQYRGGSIDDIWLQVDDGDLEPMLSTDTGYRVAADISGPGWHQGRVVWYAENITDGYDFLFRGADLEHSFDDVAITFEGVLRGEDELYGQEHDQVVLDRVGPIHLFRSVHYSVNVSMDQGMGAYSSTIPSDLLPYATAPVVTIGYGDVLIPLQLVSGDLGYRGIIPIYTDEIEITITVECSGRSSNSFHIEVPVTLMEDHAPSLKIKPDPYLDPYNRTDRRLTISPGLAISHGRRYAEDPTVSLASGKLNLTSSWSTDGVKWSVVLQGEEMEGGGALTFDVRTEYSFFTHLLLIFPFPPFLIGVPPVFIGWSLVGWFLLTSMIIMWACVTLVLRQRPKFGKGIHGPHHLEKALSDWGLVETSRVFSAVIFFSIAVYVLFQMLEQPTPTPSLLSSSVPVW